GPAATQPRQTDRQRLTQATSAVLETVPRPRRGLLSGGASNMIHLLQFNRTREGMAPQVAAAAAPDSAAATAPSAPAPAAGLPPLPGAGTTRVSNARLDFTRSVTTGFTQSGTATAWCADSLVIGYNDSGSLLETMEEGEGLSFIGFSLSQDNGRTFLDLGSIPPDPDPNTLLGGSPSVVCTNADLFHFSSLFLAYTGSGPLSGVSVSHSTNGGAVWDRPVVAVSKDATQHMIDKD